MDDQIIAVIPTPEMATRLEKLSQDILKLIDDRTKNPHEAFIVLDHARRQLELEYGIVLVSPIDCSQVGST